MKNLKSILILTAVFTIVSNVAFAGVTFLPEAEGSVGGGGTPNNVSSAERCQYDGYKTTSCAQGQTLTSPCPSNGNYYKGCCPDGYHYTKEECINAGLSYSRSSCGGFYKCS